MNEDEVGVPGGPEDGSGGGVPTLGGIENYLERADGLLFGSK
jgi:hypothetical protein